MEHDVYFPLAGVTGITAPSLEHPGQTIQSIRTLHPVTTDDVMKDVIDDVIEHDAVKVVYASAGQAQSVLVTLLVLRVDGGHARLFRHDAIEP
jgi:hypothetical protein